jgi:hypothetical protein
MTVKRFAAFFGLLLPALALTLAIPDASAQDYLTATGNPTFSVNIPVENGYINVANGNLHMEIPIATHTQRGALQLNERFVYDSKIWKIVQNGGYSWQPTNVQNSMAGWRFISGAETGIATNNVNHSVAGQDFTPIGCTRLFHGSTHLGRIISLMLRGGSLPLIAVITQCSSRHPDGQLTRAATAFK